VASTGSVGDSYDNALMENFFSTLKTELVHRKSWRTREEAENALFAYIDGWYNTELIQARLGWRSPDEHEAAWHADHHHHPAADAAEPDPAAAR
jgi:transposase InsO family protein